MNLIFSLALFIAGMLTGIGIMRYAYGLGVKSVMHIQDNVPLTARPVEIDQDSIFEDEEVG